MLNLAMPFTFETLDTARPGQYPIALNPTTFAQSKFRDFRTGDKTYRVDAVSFRNGPNRSNREFVLGQLEYRPKDQGVSTYEDFLSLAKGSNTKLLIDVILHPGKIFIGGSHYDGPLGNINAIAIAIELFKVAEVGRQLPAPWTAWHTFV